MIVTFSISNFRSFDGEQTLSMVASRRMAEQHPSHAVPIPDSDERVLRAAVLYGANEERPVGAGRSPFLFANRSTAPTEFDLQFIAGDRLYRYGVTLDNAMILAEWLARVEHGRETMVFERRTSGEGAVDITLPDPTPRKLEALAEVGGRPNRTFLAAIQANLQESEIGPELASVCLHQPWLTSDGNT